ncbi:hypothetical protein [Nocardia jejuensis]|uniref:hypothetical protein n=1 Tax=Nocardia jejuensis TaxID=328049 RepID=UPI0008372231|nr:hypothetical protein [Nocardia jejuensis]
MTTPSVPGALDSAVADVLRGTALGPTLDRPINDILQDMGLPSLPQLPPVPALPELPPLPVIDLSALTRPLTDLAASFGTGQLGNVDATQVLSGVSSALQQVVSVATSLMSLASQWQGDGATGAAEKGAAAQTNAVELQGQNVQQKTVLAGAATTVATGAASMAGIITKFITGATIAAPFLVTPPGQVFLLSLASETAAEATAVVASTRSQLTVESAEMTVAGKKVDVTDAPKGVDSLSQLTQLISAIQPLASAVGSGVQTVQQQLESIAEPIETQSAEVDPVAAALAGGGGVAGGVGGLSAIGGLAATTPLSQWSGTRSMSAAPGAPAAPSAEPVAGTRPAATTPGMIPPMAGAGLAPQNQDSGDEDIRTNMVTGEHGDEVVGELGNTGVPVVGAVGTTSPRSAV